MIQIKKTILTLVALLAVTTGAWATPNSIVINGTPLIGDKSISLTYYFDPANVPNLDAFAPTLKVKCPADNKWDEIWLSLSEVSSGTTNVSLENLGEFEAGKTYEVCFAYNNGDWVDEVFQSFVPAAAAPTGPEVDWNKASKTGTFKMPGGNVTLEPEYYPQATVADGGVTAATGVQATTDAELVTIDKSKFTGASGLKYFVGTTDAAPAYTATGWTDKVPTAADITTPGPIYVWYYPVGADGDTDDATFSDGDINATALQVTINPAPTYAVTFADGTPESDKWTASPNTGVSKGTTITVTYTGQKKILGVKAEKKLTPSLSLTNPAVGQIIGSDGKNYAYGSLPTGVTAVAKICYVSGSNGLALALTDEEGTMNWSTAQTTCAAHTPAITGGTWKLATKDEWDNMINAAGGYSTLRNGFSSVDGTNMKEDYPYWSSTEEDSDYARCYFFGYGLWGQNNKNLVGYVRACLAF